MPQWLKQKLHLRGRLEKVFRKMASKTLFSQATTRLAASTFFPSPFFEDAAILTMDGVGEWDTCTIGVGEGNKLALCKALRFPHSLGLLYSAFTYFCGFKVNSGEYKLMGLVSYGKPIFRDLIMDRLIDLKDDGSFELNLDYFNYCQGLTMTNDCFSKSFDAPPCKPEETSTELRVNLASSIQAVTGGRGSENGNIC